MQLQLERSLVRASSATGRPTLVVMDRGVMDPSAYMPHDVWESILARNGWTDADFLARYDLVLHLVTAADGAEKFYTTANNATRKESPAQARAMDKAVLAAWSAHPAHRVVGNEGDFKAKLDTVVSHILPLVGAPAK